MNYKQAMWRYLIRNGMVLERKSYYGDTHDWEATKTLQEKTKNGTVNINWDKTSEVRDDYDVRFMGTFCDSKNINYLEGTLVLDNGKKTVWHMELDNDWSFCDTVRFIVDLMEK